MELTVIDWLVAPLDQRFPEVADEVSTTFPPEQNVVEPLAVITGIAGAPGSDKDCVNVLETHPLVLVNVME